MTDNHDQKVRKLLLKFKPDEVEKMPFNERLEYYSYVRPLSIFKAFDWKEIGESFSKQYNERVENHLSVLKNKPMTDQIDYYEREIREMSILLEELSMKIRTDSEERKLKWLNELLHSYEKRLTQLKKECTPPPNPPPPKTELKDIFQHNYFEDIFPGLLLECEVLDVNGQLLITPGDGSELYGLIAAVKEYSAQLLIHNKYSYPKLLKLFNEYLNTTYGQVKPENKNAKISKKFAVNFIKNKLP
jgi:hypothetical protein